MIPRIFVSSTYYDLKHVRERLEKFIESYGFEPILFESDKVTYQHGKEIDQSAYFEVGLCHMMVLIIGGRYGSPSSQAKLDEERKQYDEDYISITRKEFETACQKNIPILIFIDKNVYSEHQTYKENQEFFDNLYFHPSKDSKKFKFAHVDHVNIFKFIDVVRIKPIKTFEKIDEIETYIKLQLSGMFYLYLESLKKQSEDNKILDTISELNNVTLRMNEMLSSVGKEILGKDKKEYEKVIENQVDIVLSFFLEKFSNNLEFTQDFDRDFVKKLHLEKAAKFFYEALTIDFNLVETGIKAKNTFENRLVANNIILANLRKELTEISELIHIKNFSIRTLNKDLKEKVLPLLKGKHDEEKIIKGIETILLEKLSDLPF